MKGRNYEITFKFKNKPETVPSVRILTNEVKLRNVDIEGFTVTVCIPNVHKVHIYKISVSVNNHVLELEQPLQFCPACKELLPNWPVLKVGPTLLHTCPICGNVFIPKNMLAMAKKQNESGIVLAKDVKMIDGVPNIRR
jgi:hypothetical protein